MKRKLLISLLGLAIIAAMAFLVVLILGGDKQQKGAAYVNRNTTQRNKEDGLGIDFAKLNSAIEKVPVNYSIYLNDSVSYQLDYLLNYVKINKLTMTQEEADEYADKIENIIESIHPFSDVPQVYIKTGNRGSINTEYSSASIVIIDAEGGEYEDIMDVNVEIKLRGNSTIKVGKKPYTFKFSEKKNVLGMGKAKKWFLNANAIDKTLMRNRLVFDFASKIGLEYIPETAYVDVWLDGKYMGNYLLSEVIEESPKRVDIDTKNGDFLIERELDRVSMDTTYFTTPIYGIRFGVNEPKDITQEQLEELISFMGKIETAIQARDWDEFIKYVDEKSYIDFYILSELFKTVDFDYSSTRFYIKDGKLYAGPPWDNDLSCGNADDYFYYDYTFHEGYTGNSSYIGIWCNTNMYSFCYEFPEFKDALSTSYLELQEVIQNLYEDNSLGRNQIDLLLDRYGESFERNYTTAGWALTRDILIERIPEISYEENVEYLREWLEKRNQFLLDSFK